MPKLKESDLQEKYVWKVSEGDDPKLVEEDAHHLSRKEGYEMLLYLNNLGIKDNKIVYGEGKDISTKGRLIFEWMIKNHLKSTSPGRGTVTAWLNANFESLHDEYPY